MRARERVSSSSRQKEDDRASRGSGWIEREREMVRKERKEGARERIRRTERKVRKEEKGREKEREEEEYRESSIVTSVCTYTHHGESHIARTRARAHVTDTVIRNT